MEDALADERAGSVDGDDFGHARFALGQHALHGVGIVDAHTVHYPLVIQFRFPSTFQSKQSAKADAQAKQAQRSSKDL